MMNNIFDKPGVKILSIIITLLIIVNLSIAGDLYPRNSVDKKFEIQSKWSISIYAALAFGDPGVNFRNTSMYSGSNDPYMNFYGGRIYNMVSGFRPQAWMIQIDRRISKYFGTGFIASYSLLRKANGQSISFVGLDDIPGRKYSVTTMSLLFTIYLTDFIVLGFGPSYNMTNAPANGNKIGLLAHLNVRIPLNENFSINGICQYRYMGSSTIGPFAYQNTDETLTPTLTTNTEVFPATELNYSHFFFGIGMGLNFDRGDF